MSGRTVYEFPHGQHLSPTQITEYLACPLCWRMSRLDRVPKPMSISLAIGGAIHKGVERWRQDWYLGSAREKVESGLLGDAIVEHFVEHAAEHFDQSLEVDGETGGEVVLDLGPYANTGEAKDHTVELTTYLLPEIAKLDTQRKLIAAELDLQEFDNPWPFPMRGRVDALYGPEPELCDKGLDLKTSSKQIAPDFAAALQLAIYRSFLPVPWFADVLAKTKLPSFQTYVLSEEGDDFVRHLVMEVADRICRGDFPARPGYRCKYRHGNPTFYAAASWPEVPSA